MKKKKKLASESAAPSSEVPPPIAATSSLLSPSTVLVSAPPILQKMKAPSEVSAALSNEASAMDQATSSLLPPVAIQPPAPPVVPSVTNPLAVLPQEDASPSHLQDSTLLPLPVSSATISVSVQDGVIDPHHSIQTKPSWLECVKGSSLKFSTKPETFLLDSGEPCVKIPDSVIKRNEKQWDCFIIGQFHGNRPSMGALHAILNGIWSKKAFDISISKSGDKCVLIKIPNQQTRKRVLDQGMWHIESQAMFVAQYKPGVIPIMPAMKEAPVWLDFHDVLPHFFSAEGLTLLASAVGKPLHLHPNTVNRRNMEIARVYTIVDLTKPLPKAVHVRLDSGETHRFKLTSPWLPPLCAHCNEMGHSIRRCPTAPVTCVKCKSTSHRSDSCPRMIKRKAFTKEPRLPPRSRSSQVFIPVQKTHDVPLSNPGNTTSTQSLALPLHEPVKDSVVVDIGLDNLPRLYPTTNAESLTNPASMTTNRMLAKGKNHISVQPEVHQPLPSIAKSTTENLRPSVASSSRLVQCNPSDAPSRHNGTIRIGNTIYVPKRPSTQNHRSSNSTGKESEESDRPSDLSEPESFDSQYEEYYEPVLSKKQRRSQKLVKGRGTLTQTQ